jgi:hypothetical protein
MKNQKILFALGLSTILFSCSNDESVFAKNSSETETTATILDSKATFKVLDATSIPASISKTIVAQYPGGTLTQVNLLSSGVYEAIVSTNSITSKGNSRLKVSFTSRGTVKSTTTQTSVVVANLPTSITSYIATNYIGAVINSAHIESDGRYDVLITTTSGVVTKIYFTAAGVYISAYTATTKGVQTVIAVADLLIDITNYISANYVGSTITSAYMDSDGSYDVYITTAGGVNTKLDFTAAGVFVLASSGTTSSVNQTHTSVVISSLPTAISTYISANYLGSTITSAYMDSDGSYDVYITTAGGVNAKLDFTAAGVFVSASSGNDRTRH